MLGQLRWCLLPFAVLPARQSLHRRTGRSLILLLHCSALIHRFSPQWTSSIVLWRDISFTQEYSWRESLVQKHFYLFLFCLYFSVDCKFDGIKVNVSPKRKMVLFPYGQVKISALRWNIQFLQMRNWEEKLCWDWSCSKAWIWFGAFLSEEGWDFLGEEDILTFPPTFTLGQ